MAKFFYITTPIFYPNAKLHLGHAYSMTMADIIARYKKSQGYQVYFQTGSDDHGEKIEKKAQTLKITPLELVNQNVLLFQELWQKLGVEYDFFYRTSSLSHREKVQKIFTQLLNQGNIYLGQYKGDYCVSCEDYISEGKIVHSGLCPFCQSELYPIAEPAYFLRLSKYHSQLLKHYSQNLNFLLPANIKKELFENFLKNEVRDLCITRQGVKWGITVPQDERLTIYVWFEALLNYLNSEQGEKLFLSSYSELPKEKKINNAKEVSCVAIQNKNGEYLLVYNKKYDKWQIPGGKLEPGETPLQAAQREIFEETNLIVKDLKKFGEKTFYVDDIWWKVHFYQTNDYSGELLVKEPDTIREAKFFKISEIEKINSRIHDVVTEYLLEKMNTGEIIHLIGKEITRFHAIYWPIILFFLNKRLPDKVLAHGWLTTPQGKMSKSKGSVIDPLELLKKYPSDLLRAYFIAKINFLQDGVCSKDLLKEFYQDFLVNNLGNLCSRIGKMLELYCDNLVPEFEKSKNVKLDEYYQNCFSAVKEYQNLMDNYQLTKAFQEIQKLLNLSNKLIHELEPWNLFKSEQKKLLYDTLNYLTNGIKIIAFLLQPITPESSTTIFEFLNVSNLNWKNLLNFSQLSQIKIKKLTQHLYTKL